MSVFAWYVTTFEPNSVHAVAIFYLFVFMVTAYALLYLLNNVRRSIQYALGFVIYLLLRQWDLREFIYPMFLIAMLLSVELMLRKR